MILEIGLQIKLNGLKSNTRHFRSSNFDHVTANWELTVKMLSLKWGKDNEREASSLRYFSEVIKKVLKNQPCQEVSLRYIR